MNTETTLTASKSDQKSLRTFWNTTELFEKATATDLTSQGYRLNILRQYTKCLKNNGQ